MDQLRVQPGPATQQKIVKPGHFTRDRLAVMKFYSGQQGGERVFNLNFHSCAGILLMCLLRTLSRIAIPSPCRVDLVSEDFVWSIYRSLSRKHRVRRAFSMPLR